MMTTTMTLVEVETATLRNTVLGSLGDAKDDPKVMKKTGTPLSSRKGETAAEDSEEEIFFFDALAKTAQNHK